MTPAIDNDCVRLLEQLPPAPLCIGCQQRTLLARETPSLSTTVPLPVLTWDYRCPNCTVSSFQGVFAMSEAHYREFRARMTKTFRM